MGEYAIKNPRTDKIEKYRKKGFETKTKAAEWEKEEKQKRRLRYSDSPENQPLFKLILRYLKAQKTHLEMLEKGEDKKAFASGWKYYREKKNTLGRFAAATDKTRPISAITPDHIFKYMQAQVDAGRSHNAVNKDKKHITAMFAWFEKRYRKTLNPARVVVDFEHVEKRPYTPPIEDVLTLLEHTRQNDLDVYHFIMLYLSSGARRAELFRLRWESDVNFDNATLRLSSRKNKKRVVKYDWVPMHPDTRLALTHFYETRLDKNQEYVLVIKHENQFKGQPYTERNKLLGRWCKKAEVRAFGYHALRRVFIQTLGESGAVGANQLRMLARHASLGTTSKYSHTPDPALFQAVQHAGLEALKERAAAKTRQAVPAKIIPIKERRKKAHGS